MFLDLGAAWGGWPVSAKYGRREPLFVPRREFFCFSTAPQALGRGVLPAHGRAQASAPVPLISAYHPACPAHPAHALTGSQRRAAPRLSAPGPATPPDLHKHTLRRRARSAALQRPAADRPSCLTVRPHAFCPPLRAELNRIPIPTSPQSPPLADCPPLQNLATTSWPTPRSPHISRSTMFSHTPRSSPSTPTPTKRRRSQKTPTPTTP